MGIWCCLPDLHDRNRTIIAWRDANDPGRQLVFRILAGICSGQLRFDGRRDLGVSVEPIFPEGFHSTPLPPTTGAFNEALETEGAFYLFTLRLIPVVPFFVINAVMGLTRMRAWTFWWVSQLGMLPGTAVYVYAGSRVPDLQTLADQGAAAVFTANQLRQFTLAFLLLGLFPFVARLVIRYIKGRTDARHTVKSSRRDDANVGDD